MFLKFTKENNKYLKVSNSISFSFENGDDVIRISGTDDNLYVIEENDYEVVLSKAQMEFIIESYHKILDLFKDDKEPR